MPPARDHARLFTHVARRPCSRLMVLTACLLLAGCPAGEEDAQEGDQAPPYAGAQLRVVLPAALRLAQVWEPAVNDWADANSATVEVMEFDFAAGEDDWQGLLLGQPTSLVLLPTPLLGELVGSDNAASMPDELNAQLQELQLGPPPTVRDALAMLGSEQAFVVTSCPTPYVVLRRDLLQAANRQPPRTWEEYDRLVRELAQWAPGKVAVEPRSEQSLATLFLARAVSAARHPAQHSVELDVSDAEPLIDTPPYVRALTEMQALTPHLPDDVRSMTPTDCLQELVAGRAAIGISWPTREADKSAEDLPRREGTLAFLPVPGRSEIYDRDQQDWTSTGKNQRNQPVLCGFGGHAVAVTTAGTKTEQSAAWSLWGLLSRYQREGTIPAMTGRLDPAGKVNQEGPLRQLEPGERSSLAETNIANLQNTLLVGELPMAGRTRLRAALTGAIEKVLDGNADPAAALEEAGEQWSQIIDEIGRNRVLNSYRLRLGLVPVPE
jgi:multiple sugar transport system substrate-binding protein